MESVDRGVLNRIIPWGVHRRIAGSLQTASMQPQCSRQQNRGPADGIMWSGQLHSVRCVESSTVMGQLGRELYKKKNDSLSLENFEFGIGSVMSSVRILRGCAIEK